MTLRIGLLGASRIAEEALVGPAAELGYRLVAVAARDRGRAQVFAEKYGVEGVLDSYDDVLADTEVDAIYNPLANSLHAPWNLAAVRADKPVLTEKPFASNRIEAQQVHDAAVAAGIPVLEAFHYLFHPVTQRVLDLATDGTLGTTQHIEVAMAMPEPDAGDPRWALDMAGGVLMDLGCYALHFLRMFGRRIGEPPTVVSASAVERTQGVDESCAVTVAFPSGVTALSTNTMTADAYSFTIRVQGTDGDAFVHNFVKPSGDDRLTVTTADGTRVEHLGTRASYTYQLEAFAARVLDGTPLPIDTADAVENMAFIDSAYRAAGLNPR